MEIVHWLKKVQGMINKLEQLDFGYPLDTNVIYARSSQDDIDSLNSKIGDSMPASILEFYTHCGGISLPDVWNGYYIYSIEIILSSAERYIPTKIYGTPPYDILVFGGNGGGRLFASRLDSEEIIYLREGSVVNSTFNRTDSR
jgi:hypothetical protein